MGDVARFLMARSGAGASRLLKDLAVTWNIRAGDIVGTRYFVCPRMTIPDRKARVSDSNYKVNLNGLKGSPLRSARERDGRADPPAPAGRSPRVHSRSPAQLESAALNFAQLDSGRSTADPIPASCATLTEAPHSIPQDHIWRLC